MVKVKAQGTLVLPFKRINELLKTVDTDENKFYAARNAVLEDMNKPGRHSIVNTIDFEVTGNRVHVTCETRGESYKETLKQSFDILYAVISQLMTLTLKTADIENEDTLMSVKDLEILSTED